MKNSISSKDIISFLNKMKRLVLEGKFQFVDRKKNLDSLAKYGLTIKDLKHTLFDLCVKDYYAGPKSDDDFSLGEIWEFIRRIETINFYIKLKLEEEENGEIIVCISFHESNRG